jgi:NAD(P)-dependent dehydrogenase (short-subunit alcohol dehydrogenase family)
MAERWSSDDELEQMSRPTMDRAIEALDRGDIDAARALCEEMKHEWRYLHDLMAEGIGGLISFVQERLGDQGVADAWTSGQGRGWRRDVEAIANRDRRQIVLALAATWRAHSCSGSGPHPGAFTITEDDEKFTFDVRDVAAVRAGAGDAIAALGGCDAVVANAEAVDTIHRAERFSDDEWRKDIESNLHGAFYLAQAASRVRSPTEHRRPGWSGWLGRWRPSGPAPGCKSA